MAFSHVSLFLFLSCFSFQSFPFSDIRTQKTNENTSKGEGEKEEGRSPFEIIYTVASGARMQNV